MTDELEKYIPMVKGVAHQMISKLPANIELDDLIQVGMIGLWGAIERYEEKDGTKFSSYAYSRIKGAMLDELREMDWLPRGSRKNLVEADEILLYEDFVKPGDEHFLEHVTDSGATDPLNALMNDEALRIAISTISNLKPREQALMKMYHDEEISFKQIGSVFGVSESRASQIHNRIIDRLQAKIEE